MVLHCFVYVCVCVCVCVCKTIVFDVFISESWKCQLKNLELLPIANMT